MLKQLQGKLLFSLRYLNHLQSQEHYSKVILSIPCSEPQNWVKPLFWLWSALGEEVPEDH